MVGTSVFSPNHLGRDHILSGVGLPNLASEVSRLVDVGCLGLAPEHVSVRSERELAFDGSLHATHSIQAPKPVPKVKHTSTPPV